jgi:hypothetical protein
MEPTWEAFRLPVSTSAAEAACHRALRSPGWRERPTDSLEIDALGFGSGDGLILVWLLERLPVLGWRIRRLRTLTLQAPAGHGASVAEILASYGDGENPARAFMVRVSLNELGAEQTDLTIAWSGDGRQVPVAVRELRRSIEINAGSTTPYRPSM